MTSRYQTVRVDGMDLRESIKALAYKRRRLSYRRLPVLLQRSGQAVSQKCLFRMYREEKLHVRRPGGAGTGCDHRASGKTHDDQL